MKFPLKDGKRFLDWLLKIVLIGDTMEDVLMVYLYSRVSITRLGSEKIFSLWNHTENIAYFF